MKKTSQPLTMSMPACRAPHPGGVYLCTLVKGHTGQHKHVYSGPVIDGFRRGTSW